MLRLLDFHDLFFRHGQRAGLEHGGATGAAIVVMTAKLISLIATVLVKHIEFVIVVTLVFVVFRIVLGRLNRFTRLSTAVDSDIDNLLFRLFHLGEFPVSDFTTSD